MGKRGAGILLMVIGVSLLAIYFFGFLNWFHTKPSDDSVAALITILSFGFVIGGPILAIWGLVLFASGGEDKTSNASSESPFPIRNVTPSHVKPTLYNSFSNLPQVKPPTPPFQINKTVQEEPDNEELQRRMRRDENIALTVDIIKQSSKNVGKVLWDDLKESFFKDK